MVPRALLVVGWLTVGAAMAQAQSLADVAKAEEARRKTIAATAKVYTNDDLRPDFTKAVPPSAATETSRPDTADATAPAADTPGTSGSAARGAASEGEAIRDEAYWRGRITQARSQLERTRAFTTAMRNRVDMLWTDFVNRDDPVQRGRIEKERLDAIAELERLEREVVEHERAVSAVEEEARRAGVPAGWLRPS